MVRPVTLGFIAQLAGAVEYTDCTSAEGLHPHQGVPSI